MWLQAHITAACCTLQQNVVLNMILEDAHATAVFCYIFQHYFGGHAHNGCLIRTERTIMVVYILCILMIIPLIKIIFTNYFSRHRTMHATVKRAW